MSYYPREPLACDGFTASVEWAGRIYSTVCYEVSVRVVSPSDAIGKRDKIRAAIAAQRPTWEVGEDRLVADPAGRAVFLVVNVSFEDL